MSIEISFDNFDTMCYSNQHNIIELINRAVAMGLQININIQNIDKNTASIGGLQSQISQTQDDLDSVKDFAEEGHLALLLGQNLNERLSQVEGRLTHVWENDNTFQTLSPLGQKIAGL